MNPSWPEANQLAIFTSTAEDLNSRYRKQIQLAGLERALTTRPRCLLFYQFAIA